MMRSYLATSLIHCFTIFFVYLHSFFLDIQYGVDLF